MNRIRAIKCCHTPHHAVLVYHMTTHTHSSTPIKHVRACQTKCVKKPDTTPCTSKGARNLEELHA